MKTFKKIPVLVLLSLLLSVCVYSQTPSFYNYSDTNAGSNTFPLGTGAGRMAQFLSRPGELNHPSVAPSGNILKVYFLTAKNFGPFNYNQVNLLLGQATITDLPTSAFYTGTRDTVYNRATVSLSGTPLTWLIFTLDHPFVYDNTKSLIIQLEHRGASGSASYIHAHTYLTGKRRTYSNTANPFGVQGQDAYIINFGVDIGPNAIDPNINLQTPKEYKLEQNFPNPFNPTTSINYSIPKSGLVTLRVYNVFGQEVSTLVNEVKNNGNYSVDFNASNLSSGVYYYELTSGNFVQTKRMMLIK
ncbi:MAG: T9SS type A sorting domain-containing protein [Candidatus Kapaibacterium sp.]